MKQKKASRVIGRVFRLLLKILLIILTVLAVVITIAGILLAFYVEKNVEKSIDETVFLSIGTDGVTKLYYYEFEDRENRVGDAYELVGEELYGGYNCIYAEYEEIPKNLLNAFISIEDKRFNEHSGVDWKRTVSAGFNYFLKFSNSYGGSTITQQLIKNVTQKDEYSFKRKIQEIYWALDLERKMSKQEIIEMYLNIINLSQGCYGVKAASSYYFSKDISELTLSECACIAAITNSPSYYDPILNPENNKYRRELILNEMYAQGYISESELGEALADTPVLCVSEERDDTEVNSWYADMVIEDVITALMEEKGYSRQIANLMIYTGGLKIYTAMDKDIQSEVEKYYKNTLNFYTATDGETPQSSMIVIDNRTGDILAVAGAVGEKKGNRVQNFATQTVRPAGSVIKPLSVYAPAFDKGLINWASVYDDVPVNFGNYNLDSSKGAIVEPKAWPANSSGTYRGLSNINYALEHSLNTVVVRVLMDLGLQNSFDFLYDDLQMKSLLLREETEDGRILTDMDVAALALGQFNYGLTVREVTAAYSALANNGVYNKPRSYLSVTDASGNVVLSNDYEGSIVLSEETAQIMTQMLSNVVKNGTAAAITLDTKIDCAGKTGTTQNNYDRWYVGYTPYYICGVWYGYEYPKAIVDGAGNRCIKIWDDVMTRIHSEYIEGECAPLSFELNDNVIEAEYCADSGLMMTDTCRHDARGDRSEKGYFVKGTEPTRYCNRHVSVAYDTVNGGIADDDCPSEYIEYVGLISVERIFPMQIYVTDAQYVFRDIGKKITPNTSPKQPFFANLLGENEYCGISRTELQYNRYCRVHFNYYNWKEKQEEK